AGERRTRRAGGRGRGARGAREGSPERGRVRRVRRRASSQVLGSSHAAGRGRFAPYRGRDGRGSGGGRGGDREASGREAPGERVDRLGGRYDSRFLRGQADLDLAALALTLAGCGHGPAVCLHEPPHETQPYAEPSVEARGRTIALGEHLEDPLHHLGRDSDPVVPDADYERPVLRSRIEADPAAVRRELGRVPEEVRENLGEPRAVAVQKDRL